MDSKDTSAGSTNKPKPPRRPKATTYGVSTYLWDEGKSEPMLTPNDDRRIPGERSSGRAPRRNYNEKASTKDMWSGKINSGLSGLESFTKSKETPGTKNPSTKVDPQPTSSKRVEASSSSKAPVSRSASTGSKRKTKNESPDPDPWPSTKKRSRNVAKPNAGQSNNKPAGGSNKKQPEQRVREPPKEDPTLGPLFLESHHRSSQADLRQVLEGMTIDDAHTELTVAKSTNARAPETIMPDQQSTNESASIRIAVAHSSLDFTHQQEAPEPVTTRITDFSHGQSVRSTVSDLPDVPFQFTHAARAEFSSPLSDVPPDIIAEIERERATRNAPLSPSGATGEVKVLEALSADSALLSSTATVSGSDQILSQAEAAKPERPPESPPARTPSLTIAQIKPTMSRPRRLKQPIKRFGAGSEDNPLDLIEAPGAETSYGPLPSRRKRALSDGDFEEDVLEPKLSQAVKKQKIVKLPVSLTQRLGSTSISKKPQRKAPLVRRQPKEQPQPSLPTPESTVDGDEYPSPQAEGLDVSEELLALSHKLSAREPLHSKPAPIGQPTVWADSRQALCETVPYFKMPQSGCHQRDGHVYSFLYDGIGHPREYMDTDLIIARAGGSMEQDANGQLQQKKDHSMDEAQVQAVLNDIEHQNPVVIICGNKHAGAICKMPHRYCVLGWYKPVDVWAEKTLGKGKKAWTTIKYRLERLDSSKGAWYAPSQRVITDEDRKVAGPLVRKTCRDCNIESPHVYLNGWMCLNSPCERFWKLDSGEDAPYGKLHYHPAFLLDRTSWANELEPYDVRPPVPDSGKVIGDNLTKINTRGIVCPQCGRCNHRRLWRGWTCDNANCNFEAFPIHVPVKPALLHQPWDSVGDGPTLSQNKYAKHLGVEVDVSHKLGFKIFTYTFDGIDGKLVHAVSNAKINRASGGPDEMFEAMQRQDDPEMNLHLERRPFIGTGSSTSLKLKPAAKTTPAYDAASLPTNARTSSQPGASQPEIGVELTVAPELQDAVVADLLNTSHGLFDDTIDVKLTEDEPVAKSSRAGKSSRNDKPSTIAASESVEDGDLMTSFSMNYGMPYKFVAGGASLPFASAPWPVRACRADLNWASKNFSDPAGHVEFNEQLIFAYMEGQKVEYHDDGETGLGARIASMSFGNKAKMMLRMKTKHYVGCSKTGVLTQDKPVPGSIDGDAMYRKRLAAWQDLQELKITNKPAYEKRRKELPRELGIFEKKTKKAEDLVTITLNHGDIVLMEGYEIQQYLEHKVVPEGCLRFALTCRTVLPEHLKPEERPTYGVEADEPHMSSLVRLAAAESEANMEVVSQTSA